MLRALQQKCSIDLTIQSQKNDYDIYITKYGRKEDFGANQLSAHSSSLARPRYFRKGVAVSIQDQINLMKAVTGIDKQHSDEDTMKRRQGSWKDWYNGNGNNNAYYRRDLKDIADEFQHLFDDHTNLPKVEKEIWTCLKCFGFSPSRQTRSSSRELSIVTPGLAVATTTLNKDTPTRVTLCAREMHVTGENKEDLSLTALRQMNPDDLAFLEINLFPGMQSDASRVSHSEAQPINEFTELRTRWLNYFGTMTAASKMQVKRNIKKARVELIAKMPHGLFLPTEAQSLESWLIDGRRYTNSSIPTTRVPPINYNLSETPGKAELTAVAASLMRHILFAHRIPLHNFPDIMQCFAVLLLGRPFGLDEFSTGSTLGRHITKLDIIDWYFQMVEFSKYITALSTNGFPRYWYSSSDDSKHNKTDRHALAFSSPDVNGDPSYKTLSTMPATGKDADSNAEMNFNLFKDKIDPLALVMTWKRKRSEANLDRESDLDKFTKVSFWNGIQVDPLKGNIPLVLPSFNYDINTWTTKTTFLVVLKEHLDRLNSMAIDESIKTHDSVEVSRIEGKYERLSLFVKLDGSTLLSGPRDKKRAKISKTKSVFEFSGTNFHCVGKKEVMCDTNEDIDLTEEID